MNAKENEFDQFSEDYDAALERGISVSGEDKNYFAQGRLRWLKKRLVPLRFSARKVLDFGCGTGAAVPFILRELEAAQVTGVDVSMKSLEVARRLHLSPQVQFLPLDSYQKNGAIDLAYCNGVFHHIPPAERAKAVAYVHEALRPGGLFAFCENNPWNPGTRHVMSRIPFDRDAITLSPPEAQRLLKQGGFEVLRKDFLFFFPRFLSWLRWLEPSLGAIPLGAQYMILARKPDPR